MQTNLSRNLNQIPERICSKELTKNQKYVALAVGCGVGAVGMVATCGLTMLTIVTLAMGCSGGAAAQNTFHCRYGGMIVVSVATGGGLASLSLADSARRVTEEGFRVFQKEQKDA